MKIIKWLLIPKKALKELYKDFSSLLDGIPYIKEDEPYITAIGKKFETLIGD